MKKENKMAALTENEIRKIAEQAVKQLGEKATPENIEKVVNETVARLGIKPEPTRNEKQFVNHNGKRHERVIITAFGKNSIGILAGLTQSLAQLNCNILDLSQKILQEFFTIMLLVDITEANASFEEIKRAVTEAGEKLELKVIVQHEQIFKTMHRV